MKLKAIRPILLWDSNPAIDFIPGALLLLAALAKAGNLNLFGKAVYTLFAAGRAVGSIPAWATWLAIAAFAAELTCGCMLITCPCDRRMRRLAASLFTLFSAIQFYRYNQNLANPCGCFGLLQGAALLRPFSEPGYALMSNLTLAAVLLGGDVIRFFRIFARIPGQ